VVLLVVTHKQDAVAHLSFDQRQNVVIGLDFKTRRLLTSHLDLVGAAGVDRVERLQLALFRFAHTGTGDTAIKLTAGQGDATRDEQQQHSFAFHYHLKLSNRFTKRA